MKPFLLLALLLSLPLSAESVTAAWRLPIDKLAPDLKKNPDYAKLSSSLGESYFIHPGDELRSVAKALHWQPISPLSGDPEKDAPERRDWQGDWIVWNARSHMLVARGSWEDLLAIDHLVRRLHGLSRIRARLELVDGRSQPLKPLEVVTPAEGPVKVEPEDGLNLQLEGTTDLYGVSELELQTWWPDGRKGGRSWSTQSSVRLTDRERTLIAQYGGANGKDGAWKLYATASEELEDGTRPEDATRLERPDHQGDEPWPTALMRQEAQIFPMADGRAAGFFRIRDGRYNPVMEETPEVEAPAELSGWVRGKVLDVSKQLKHLIGEERPASIYYDVRNSRIIAISAQQDMDTVSSLFEELPELFHQNVWTESDAASGNWGMLSSRERSGIITHEARDRSVDLQFTVINTPANGGIRTEVSSWLSDGGLPVAAFRSEGIAMPGQPLKLAEFTPANGKPLSMTITCRNAFARPRERLLPIPIK